MRFVPPAVLGELSATDMVLVVVTVVSILTVASMVAVLLHLLSTVRRLTAALGDLTEQAIPLMDELAESLAEANAELARVDRLVGSAESISATVDATSKLAYRALSAPVIKTVAVTSGASKAARRLRGPVDEPRRGRSGRK